MLSIANHIGFSINQNSLQLVEVVRESARYCLGNVDEHIFDEEINFYSDETKLISSLQTALEEISNRTPLKSSNISISFPISKLIFFEIFYESSLSKDALNNHIEWEFSVLFPELDAKNYLLRNISLHNTEKQNKMLVVAAPKKIVELLSSFAESNNFNLKYIDNSHYSSDSTIILSDNKTTLSVYVDLPFVSLNSYVGKQLNSTSILEVSNKSEQASKIISFIESNNIAYDKIYIASSVEVDELKLELEERNINSIELVNPFEFIPISESFIQNANFINKTIPFSDSAGICFRKF